MFPPRQVQTERELLDDVLDSLQRAGLELTSEVDLNDGEYHFLCRVHPNPTEQQMLRKYIRSYCAAAEWEATVLFQRRPSRSFSISLEKASSRVWKNA